jgi:hypothetical protein
MWTQLATAGVMVIGVAASGTLGWLQWQIVKRLLRRPNEWVGVSVISAAVSVPLVTDMLLETLVRAGLPAGAILPVGAGLLAAQLVLSTLLVGLVAWAMAKR